MVLKKKKSSYSLIDPEEGFYIAMSPNPRSLVSIKLLLLILSCFVKHTVPVPEGMKLSPFGVGEKDLVMSRNFLPIEMECWICINLHTRIITFHCTTSSAKKF